MAPGGTEDTKWPDYHKAMSSPKLERNAARQLLKYDSLFLIPANLVQEEFLTRSNLLDVMSAASAAEALASTCKAARSAAMAIAKHLSRTLYDTH